MKRKIEGDYSPETKISTVVITDRYGRYIGKAKLHPDDTPNEIIGCTIAEIRAEKARLRKRKSNINIRIGTLEAAKNEFMSTLPMFFKEAMRFLDIKIKCYKKQLVDINKEIEYLDEQENKYIKTREYIKTKYKKPTY